MEALEREIAAVGGLIQSMEAAGESLGTVAAAIEEEIANVLNPELRIDDIETAAEAASGTADNIEAESAEVAQAHGGAVASVVMALLS